MGNINFLPNKQDESILLWHFAALYHGLEGKNFGRHPHFKPYVLYNYIVIECFIQ